MAVTNADLMRAIAQNHEEYTERLDRLEAKVDKTNGRVTALELIQAKASGMREAFAWWQPAVAAAVGAVVAYFLGAS